MSTSAYAWALALVGELARAGVRQAAICPGSRSTPLALAVLHCPELARTVHLDERSAAFFALGAARVTGRPALVVTTSGTAAANLFPAVVEAGQARVPMILITADRPPEARDFGAAQTVDQVHLFGRYARWFVDLPVPEGGVAAHVRAVAREAVRRSTGIPPGPVHLNVPFREPLVPGAGELAGPPPLPERPMHLRGPGPEPRWDAAPLAASLAAAPRGLLVLGPDSGRDRAAAARVARALGYPVLADPLSGMRSGPHDRGLVITHYDAFLRAEPLAASLAPQVVVRLGAPPTSRALNRMLARWPHREVLVEPAGPRDPEFVADEIVPLQPDVFLRALGDALEPRGPGPWARRWLEAEAVAGAAVRGLLEEAQAPFEGTVVDALPSLPDGSLLVVGNSMPVRDLDTFYRGSERAVDILANRGANGIDGVLSTALGAAWVHPGPATLLVGDISFQHDIGALATARRYPIPLRVVLVHNDGGAIFSYLPQAALERGFQELFTTAHGVDFAPVVRAYGGWEVRAEGTDELRRILEREPEGLELLQVRTDRERSVALHQELWRRVERAVGAL